jgi:predicted MFS family arabinose efflux permease
MIVGTPGGGMSLNRAVSQTFVKSRGTALAITRSGAAVAATAMPPILYLVIANNGWRMGFMTLAALVLLVALPLCYFFLPKEQTGGPLADGSAPASTSPATIRSLVRNPKVLMLCAAAGLGYAPCIALLQTFQPILIDKGIAPMTAATLIGAMGGAALFSGLAGGVLVDRLWAPLVTCAAMIAGIAGCLMIMPATLAPANALMGTILLGVAQGAQIQVVAFLIARYVGLKNFSTIFGIAVMVIAILVPVYINLMTHMHEASGSHLLGLSLCIASFVAGMMAVLGMGSYPREEPA